MLRHSVFIDGAWSDAAIPRGARVLVVDVRGARTVGVVAWDGQSEAAVPFTP